MSDVRAAEPRPDAQDAVAPPRSGGLYGTVLRITNETDLEVQFSQTVKLTLNRTAVTKVVTAEPPVKTGTIV